MKIQRVNNIVGYRVFRNFRWPATLDDFSDYNLIYGWNGTGKTTFSNIFRCLERRKQLPEGNAQVIIDGRTVIDKEFNADTALPMVKVFNKEFVEENIFNTTDNISPIFILGKDSIDKQKEIQGKTKELELKKGLLAKKSSDLIATENTLDAFCISQGKLIKELLRSSGSNPYSNYNKASFREKCDELLKEDDLSKCLLSESEKESYKKQKDGTPKEKVDLISFTFQNLQKLLSEAEEILKKTVVSKIIDRLKQNPKIEQWVENGLQIHKEKEVAQCLFCEQSLPEGHIQKLEGHFNDEFKALSSDVSALVERIEAYIKETNLFGAPGKADLYDHLQAEYVKELHKLQSEIKTYVSSLKKITEKLKQKKLKLFETVNLDYVPLLPNSDKIAAVNLVLQKHNKETENYDALISEARKKLEESIVAEALSEYIQRVNEMDILQKEVGELKKEIKVFEDHIRNLEIEIIEHQQPAEELNKDIAAYLGRDELRFEVKENGYQIYRHRELATNLSEGERTAIAFLYFLKSLKDKSFDLANGIVVIDDPVSSLDSNSLFYAFGFLKERTKGAGQLLILTHNFTFFRQIKNWFNYINKKKRAFYMLLCDYIDGVRTASIDRLDQLLQNFDSEYHYLFSVIYEFSKKDNNDLEYYYHIPNIARRLLEAFLAFRQPSGDTLHKQLEKIDFDIAKKTRIYRFVNVHSHGSAIEEGPEHDISILSETPAVLKDFLQLMEFEDKKHYDQMVDIVKSSRVSE